MSATKITIEVLSRAEAGYVLSSPTRCTEFIYLLSIGDPYDQLPEGYASLQRKRRMLIADVVTEEGATEEDVREIIELAESLRLETGKVLIHCEAGVSRSTAAALIMYAIWFGPGREQEAMDHVLAQRPIAIPNRRMVQLADKLLGREGKLVAVLT